MPGQAKERLTGTAIKSITQPLLILSIAFTLPALAAAHFLQGLALDVDLLLAALFPCLFAFTHVVFMFKEPDRLQSEDFRLRDRSLSILESGKGVIRDPALLEVMRNPTTEVLTGETKTRLAIEGKLETDLFDEGADGPQEMGGPTK